MAFAFAALDRLPRIGLAELETRAALQTRVDRKYIVAVDEAGWLLETLAPDALVLEIGGVRQFTYESRYFDTPGLSSYHATAHRHRRRFKVRTRTYVDTALRWSTEDRELWLPLAAIVETKTGSAATRADRRLWRRGHRPVALSKYATGLAALRAELPAAPWRRVLRRHFTAARKELVHG